MNRKVYYATVLDAIDILRKQGFTLDFNLKENCLVCEPDKFSHDQFEVAAVYRYEGNSDPDDEATVYGIESHNGKKGILVTGYGADTDSMSTEILKKLSIR